MSVPRWVVAPDHRNPRRTVLYASTRHAAIAHRVSHVTIASWCAERVGRWRFATRDDLEDYAPAPPVHTSPGAGALLTPVSVDERLSQQRMLDRAAEMWAQAGPDYADCWTREPRQRTVKEGVGND